MTQGEKTTPIELMTGRECANALCVSLRTWQELVRRGEAPKPMKFRRSARWSVEEFNAWVTGHRCK